MKINCHCHIFSLEYVPEQFKKRFGLDLQSPLHRLIYRLVRMIIPDKSSLETWIDIAELSISDIANRLVQEMDEAGIDICTPLMMDMEFCKGFGGGVRRFEDQITETIEAVENINSQYGRPRMLPFIAADPRRKDVVDVVIGAFEQGTFKGVKIYPPMGFTPDDPRLYPIYSYCMDNHIPITAHCQNGGIPGLDRYYRLANPHYWSGVLSRFPELKLNLAHNDQTGSLWQTVIAELITKYPNVYTDLSYNTEMFYMPRRYFANVKKMLTTAKVQDRVLYGTDWYMGRWLWSERSYLRWFTTYSRRIPWCRVKFSQDDINRITTINPMNFLGLR